MIKLKKQNKIAITIFWSVLIIALLIFICGCSYTKGGNSPSKSYLNLKQQLGILTLAMYDPEFNLTQSLHNQYYNLIKETRDRGIYNKKIPYPYEEPYYSNNKEIAFQEAGCFNLLINTMTEIQESYLKSYKAKKPINTINISKKKKILERFKEFKESEYKDTPNLVFCELQALSLEFLMMDEFLEIAASGFVLDPDYIKNPPKNKSELKVIPISSETEKNWMHLIATKEHRRNNILKLINPHAFD